LSHIILDMTPETIKIQLTVTRTLAEAIRLAAQKDRRSRPSFIVKLLEDCALVKECLGLVPAPVLAPSLLDAPIPSENSSEITLSPGAAPARAFSASDLGLDEKPSEA
jgi:hypothetical protein